MNGLYYDEVCSLYNNFVECWQLSKFWQLLKKKKDVFQLCMNAGNLVSFDNC